MIPIEELIFNSRLSGLSFCQLDEKALKYATDQIVVRCAAICGCGLPSTEYFASIIHDEIVLFINNYGYKEFSLAEILTAMRINTMPGLKWPSGLEINKIHFSGNCFNVDFLSQVLGMYNQLRTILDRKFQNLIDGY